MLCEHPKPPLRAGLLVRLACRFASRLGLSTAKYTLTRCLCLPTALPDE